MFYAVVNCTILKAHSCLVKGFTPKMNHKELYKPNPIIMIVSSGYRPLIICWPDKIVIASNNDWIFVVGQYRVELPDGRVQIVSYHADHENGFIADVRYEGEAHPEPAYAPAPYVEPKGKEEPYAFQYGVSDDYSKANFNAAETSDGKVVSGSYSVALPDGRIQHVKYTADHYNGYVAEVTYEGTPVYPEAKPYAPAPAYAPVHA